MKDDVEDLHLLIRDLARIVTAIDLGVISCSKRVIQLQILLFAAVAQAQLIVAELQFVLKVGQRVQNLVIFM